MYRLPQSLGQIGHNQPLPLTGIETTATHPKKNLSQVTTNHFPSRGLKPPHLPICKVLDLVTTNHFPSRGLKRKNGLFRGSEALVTTNHFPSQGLKQIFKHMAGASQTSQPTNGSSSLPLYLFPLPYRVSIALSPHLLPLFPSALI